MKNQQNHLSFRGAHMSKFKDLITSEIGKEVLLNSLQKGKRFDGRAFDEFRSIHVQKGVIPNAEGSALASVGKTQVLAAIKFDIIAPYADKPNEGTMVAGAELLPLANANFETGPPDENSIELARIVDRGIRSAECIDFKSFFIEEGKALSIYLDLYVLDHSGNFIDTAGIAALAALTNARMPKVEDGKIIRTESVGKLKLSSLPLPITSIKVGNQWLTDANCEEESCQDARITIATTDTHVCAIQKGKGSLSKQEFFDNVEIAFKRGRDIRKVL